MTWPLSLVNANLRYGTKPLMGALRSHKWLRIISEHYAKLVFKTAPYMQFEPDVLLSDGSKVDCLWCTAEGLRTDRVILHFHGGGFTIGGAVTHKAMIARIARESGIQSLLALYRRAPEDPYPAAQEDALTVYKAVLARGYEPQDIILSGDSAGGGLVFSLLLRLQSENLPNPRAFIALSPLTDLTLSGDSITQNARNDAMLPFGWLKRSGEAYVGDNDASSPDISPLFGNFENPPPGMIIYAEDELLASDSIRIAEKLRDAGGEVQLVGEKGLPHVWTLYQGRLKAADETIKQIAAFIAKH